LVADGVAPDPPDCDPVPPLGVVVTCVVAPLGVAFSGLPLLMRKL